MTTAATHHEHGNTPAGTLFVAFELSEKTWKLGFTTGHGQKPRARAVTARDQKRVLDEIAQAKRRVVYLPNADKYRRLTRRPPKGQKVLDERALMASQRPFHSWGRPQNQPCGHTDPASAHGHPSLPLLRSLPHTPAGGGHGGTRKSSTSRRVQTWSVNPAAIAGV